MKMVSKATVFILAILFLSLIAKAEANGESTQTVTLTAIDSNLTSPTGQLRWLDTADQAYSVTYQNSYNYSQANVTVTYHKADTIFHGTLTASNLKPNFAYQLKLGISCLTTSSPTATETQR